jgi:hypothetical protein
MQKSGLVQCLYDSFEQQAGFFQFATAITSKDIDEIQKFLDAAVESRYSLCVFDVSVGKCI